MDSRETAQPQNLFIGVNEPLSANNWSDLEKKHVPVIEAPDEVALGEWFDVKVDVGGQLPHPNERRHFVQSIDLYADETLLGRADFTAVRTCPCASFRVSLEWPAKELRAYQYCNLHGTWLGRKAIKVL